MAQLALTRNVYFLPGKAAEAISWIHSWEEEMYRFGLKQQLLLEKVNDPTVHVVIQVWGSAAAYDAWNASEEHVRYIAEGERFRVRQPSGRFRVIEGPADCEAGIDWKRPAVQAATS